MRQSESINELALALSQFLGEVSNVYKDKKGYGYNYADLPSILDMVRPLLTKHNLSVIQLPIETGNLEALGLETMLMHNSGQYLASEFRIPVAAGKGMTPSQAFGSAISYARRYALCAALGIASSNDDNDGGSHPVQKTSKHPRLRLDEFFSENKIEPGPDKVYAWLQHFKVETMDQLNDTMVDAIISKYKAQQNV